MRDVMHYGITTLPRPVDQDGWHPDALDEHLVSLTNPSSVEADRYRTLRYAVERHHPKKKLIAITSAIPGDGKTTTAINLAGTLAHAPNSRVLMIDLDMRTPSVGQRLGLTTQSPNLVDLLLDHDLRLDEAIREYPAARLSVLPGGRAMMVPYELLKSTRLRELLHTASQQFDYVLLDTPPLVPVPDSRLIADCVDSYVMVVAAHRTPRRLLEDALNLMDPTKLMGIVFNGDDGQRSRYYGNYYGYGTYHSRGRHAGRTGGGRGTSLLDRAVQGVRSVLGYPGDVGADSRDRR